MHAIAEAICEEVDRIIADKDMSPANKGNATTTISKKEMGFEEEGEEFHQIYSKKLMEYYSGLRSNVQSACKAAIMGKFSSRKSYMSPSHV